MLRQLPNLLSLLRLASAPFVALLLLRSEFAGALGLVICAGLSDWLDGFTARRLGVSGKLGVILDPLADKVLLVTLFFALTAAGLIKSWLFFLVISRDVLIVAGAALLRSFRNIRRFLPSTLGKVSTFFQIVFVLTALLYAVFPYRVLAWLETLGLLATAFFTALSGLDYVRRGIRMANR